MFLESRNVDLLEFFGIIKFYSVVIENDSPARTMQNHQNPPVNLFPTLANDL